MYENTVKLIGFVGQVDVYESEGKKPFAKVILTTSKSYLDHNGERVTNTTWHQLRFYGKLVQVVKNRIAKGSYLFVSGELDYDEWQTKAGDKRVTAVINAQKLICLERPAKLEADSAAWISDYEESENLVTS